MLARTTHALELVAPHCDLVDRLRFIPPAASVRGMFFQNIEAQVERMGQSSAYHSYFPDDRYAALTYYPLSEFLLRLSCAGAVVSSLEHGAAESTGPAPERIHDGMRAITRGHATTFVQSLLGRTLVRLFSREPLRLTEQGLAARRQTHRYGRWTLQQVSSTHVQVVYEDEYLWIQSAIHGAAEGTYVTCLPEVRLETEVTGRFSGRTNIRW
jgi:uncharacterized protein (TIGR02265 family)